MEVSEKVVTSPCKAHQKLSEENQWRGAPPAEAAGGEDAPRHDARLRNSRMPNREMKPRTRRAGVLGVHSVKSKASNRRPFLHLSGCRPRGLAPSCVGFRHISFLGEVGDSFQLGFPGFLPRFHFQRFFFLRRRFPIEKPRSQILKGNAGRLLLHFCHSRLLA